MNRRWSILWRWGGVLWLALALAAACGGGTTPARPTATPAPLPTSTPAALPVATPPRAPLSLVWWTPEWLAPGAGSEGQRLLQEFVREFEAANPDIVIEVMPRPSYGRSGILDFLSVTARVAPSAMPDIVSMDLAEARTAVSLHLLQPLDALLTSDLAGFFPFVADAGRVDGVWYALPFAADVEHLVYDASRLPSPPQTWLDVVQAQPPGLFSLSNREGSASDALLAQYLSAGGVLTTADGQNARLSREPLLRVLQFYEAVRGQGLYAPDVVNLTPGEILTLYLGGAVPVAETSATEFLRRRNDLAASGFAWLPALGETRPVIVNGWGVGIAAADPQRQQAALRFIVWLLEPSRMGRWSRAAGRLPTHPVGFEQWLGDDAYVSFLREGLQVAQFVPVGPRYADARRQLRQAVGEVLTTETTAQDVVNRILGEASR